MCCGKRLARRIREAALGRQERNEVEGSFSLLNGCSLAFSGERIALEENPDGRANFAWAPCRGEAQLLASRGSVLSFSARKRHYGSAGPPNLIVDWLPHDE